MPSADELTADALLDAVQSSAKPDEAFPDLDLDAVDSPLRRVFQEEAGAAERLTARFPTTTGTLERLGDLLTGMQLAEADASTKTLAREALLRVVDLHMRAQYLDSVRGSSRDPVLVRAWRCSEHLYGSDWFIHPRCDEH